MRILDFSKEPQRVMELARRHSVASPEIESRVREILHAVETEGDEALTTFTRELDCRFIDSLGLLVTERERDSAKKSVGRDFLKALDVASRNITAYHRKQLPRSWTLTTRGATLQQRMMPLKRVGIYIPGGKASYPSTVLMNAIPARIAGVPEIVMVTPPNREGKISPEVLTAAAACGITEIYRIGGAQAIGALAFGTESIRPVDKITGPGNTYVAVAKKQVYGRVGIDVIAGPTEVVIVADAHARASYVAADLIAQAEHDESAVPICITTARSQAEQVQSELQRQIESSPRKAVVQRAIRQQGTIILVENLRVAADIVNELAPEHLEVLTHAPARFARKVTNAGAIFVGPWSTEALGDYVAGPNHTLPTSGTARFSSALSVYDFMKFTNVVTFSREGFQRVARHVEVLAEAEGLAGHAASVRIRRGRR
jgi:histidinol dehydrogenase